jgi:tetratricopeptide (TPR) repeat protein
VFKGRTEDAKTIAAKLGVAFLLDGNARLAGNRVRVDAELIQGRSGFSSWTQTFDRSIDDIFAVQTEIATAVTAALTREVAKTTTVTDAGGTTNVAAFDAYLHGRADFALAAGDDTDRSALAHFNDAIAEDPKFAAAYAARSRTLAAIANQQTAGDQQQLLYDQAIATAKQAVVLAPNLADAQSALAFALVSGRLDIRGARAPYDRSYALGRGDPDVLGRYALYCANTGRFNEAEAAIRLATDLDPLNPRSYWNTGAIRFAARRYNDAIPSMERALVLDPRMVNVNGYIGYCLLMLGRLDEAEQAILKEKSQLTRMPGLAMVAQRRGKTTQAREAFDQLVSEFGDNGLYQQAEVVAQRGDAKGAVAILRRARTAHDSGLFLARQDPLLDPIRNDPELSRLLRDLGFD